MRTWHGVTGRAGRVIGVMLLWVLAVALLAMAHVAQRLQVAATKHRTMSSMTELTLAVSTEINSALQTIAGHCAIIERAYPEPRLHRDIDTIVRQTQRIAALLDKMRIAAHERLNEAASETQNYELRSGS